MTDKLTTARQALEKIGELAPWIVANFGARCSNCTCDARFLPTPTSDPQTLSESFSIRASERQRAIALMLTEVLENNSVRDLLQDDADAEKSGPLDTFGEIRFS